jgi:hypothetical protein
MSYKTVEVDLENGHVRPCGAETLPLKGRALLTLLDDGNPKAAKSCTELAGRWTRIEKLSEAEGKAFADDIEKSRESLLPLKSAWD